MFISSSLGYLMSLCYKLVENYGIAIILFTLLSKIILLPISIWVQKNSIKMVKMQPEINLLKAKYFGDHDRIADEQAQIFKRDKYNPFASIIPLFIQIGLLMCLIDVIYHPLNYLLRLDSGVIEGLIAAAVAATGADPTASTIQLVVVAAIQNVTLNANFSAVIAPEILVSIQQLHLSFLGFNLAEIPSITNGVNLWSPAIAGLSAWLLCEAQNRSNVLQSEQSNWNKYGMMAFSIALSLYLGYFVPIGVAVYWTSSNIFAIVQLYLLNWAINPQKHVDYEALEDSKKKLSDMESLGTKKKLFTKDPNAKREKADYKRFFSIANKHLVFYSESNGFYKYFQNIIEYILENSNVSIHYITGDPNDKIFELAMKKPEIKPYYIGEKRLITLMMKMDADIVVMTTPDLETYYIKKSYIRKDIEYIYTDHGISSDNLTLRTHALDAFDTIFCVGPHQVEEARALEKLYQLKPRTLVETGYVLLDNMSEAYSKMDKLENPKKTILIAPSWQDDNIMDSCLDQILEEVLDKDYRVIVRPHPQYVRIFAAKMQTIIEKYKPKFNADFMIETDFSSNVTVYTADLLITDWSNIGYEFSFTTLKPTLYINTPMKVMNPDWEQIDIEPFDIRIRQQIGAALELGKIMTVGEVVADLIQHTDGYRQIIQHIREDSLYHLGQSGEIGAEYILEQLRNKIESKKQK